MTTLAALLARGTAQLRASPTPALDAEVLLRHAARLDRAALLADPGRTLETDRAAAFDTLLARRAAGEPVAYITGTREFWSLEITVTPAVLVPRPETELLVECALAHIPPDHACVVADLGTGSGAVALAIARERPRARVIATDISPAALAVATGNARRLAVGNIEFRAGDWYDALAGETVDIVVSNPPYVATGDPHLAHGDLRYEPALALTPGATGLEAITVLAAGARRHLVEHGWLLLEHGYDQAEAASGRLRRYGLVDVQTFQDNLALDRVTSGRSPPSPGNGS